MSVIPQTPQSFRALYQGSALDPLGTLGGPQTPSPTHASLTTNPGSAPAYGILVNNSVTMDRFVYF